MSLIEVGTRVKVDHPITCLNPDEYFIVLELRYDPTLKKVSIRGEKTCWFNVNMVVDIE